MKNVTRNELTSAIELLNGAVEVFGKQPRTGLHNNSGICWYVSNMLSYSNANLSINNDRKYRRLICIILNIKSIKITRAFMFGGNKPQEFVYRDCPNKKYERRDFCINRLKELKEQLKKMNTNKEK